MLLVTAVFLTLLCAWLLWGWIVAEDREWHLMKLWCARSFVVLATLLCLGGGAWIANRRSHAFYRQAITRFTTVLNEHAKQGRMDEVRQALREVAEAHDEWTTLNPDILVRIREVSDRLSKPSQSKVASEIPVETSSRH